jgi:glycosyltransferase involved in cell wall biosynthesis
MPRIRYIRHTENRGAIAARKTGVDASRGDILAFLDQDDLFHKQKLEMHLDYFLKSPETGLTYNDRFVIQGIEKVLWGIHRPPANLQLKDWVLGYPVSPSDVVLKREWALRDDIWDDSFAKQAEHVIFNGGEIVFGGRLALAGCKFGGVPRALNYRRHHPYRIQKYLAERCQTELSCQEIIFSDPRCPIDVRALQNLAFSKIYIMYAYVAYIQEEFDLARQFLKQAMNLDPGFFVDGASCKFLDTWLMWISAGTVDYARGHEEILKLVFENFPMELEFLKRKYDWTVAQSYLLKGFSHYSLG